MTIKTKAQLLQVAADSIESWPARRQKALEEFEFFDAFQCGNTWVLPDNGG